MNRICHYPHALSIYVLWLSGLGLLSAQAQAADSAPAIPTAYASAQTYVLNNSSKPGVRLLGGTVLGAGKPLPLSLVTIYAAGTSGYGQASVAGLGFTDEGGKIHAAYFGSSSQQLYAVATGGVVGNNYDASITLSAPLGSFSSAPSSAILDEVTTVGAAYALAQFLDSTGQKPGTSSTNVKGLQNAFAQFGNLASVTSGNAATTLVPGALGVAPTATVNTLANILASCIATGSGSSSQCANLFGAATPAGGRTPANTLAAALDIALNEGNNVAALFALAGTGPYQPALNTAPHDWSLAVSYTGGVLDAGSDPRALAIDAAGNAWVASLSSDSSVNGGEGFVVQIGPQGVQGPSLMGNGILGPDAVAVDASGNVWVANLSSSTNNGQGSISGLTSAGAPIAGSPFGGVLAPRGLSVDPAGNVWALNPNSSFLTELPVTSSYAPTQIPVTETANGVTADLGTLGIDGSGNVFSTDGNNDVLVGLSAADPTQELPGGPFSGGGLDIPTGLAVDISGNVWAVNSGGQGVTKFVAAGGTYSPVQFLVSSIGRPGTAASDGAGNLWVANQDASGNRGVVPVSNSGTQLGGTAGFYTGGGALQTEPANVAIDPSGDVWLVGAGGTNVVELVGAAKPVKTPLVGQPQLP